MPDREKLIELLMCVPSAEVIFGKREGKRYTTAWRIADHLIANGVTVRERGRWEKISHYPYYCSCCSEIAPLDCEGESHYKSNFCPNCGADMRGEEDG